MQHNNVKEKLDNMKVDQPLVSVVIPCYNHEQFVQESIQSIIDQDYQNIELIIIDDGSKDNSVKMIKAMIPACQKRFVRFEARYRSNKGLCATLNEALEWCEGEYFSPIASDDIALPHKISFQVKKIANTDISAVFGLVERFISMNGKFKAGEVFNAQGPFFHTFEDLMLNINIPYAATALIKTKSIREAGNYAEDVKLEDFYMWLSMTINNEILVTFPEVLALYRNHQFNTTKNIDEMLKSRLEVLDKFHDSEIFNSAVKKAYLMYTLSTCDTKTIQPIRTIIRYRKFDSEGLKAILKALTPFTILKLKRKIF